jgi:hypothetical protein
VWNNARNKRTVAAMAETAEYRIQPQLHLRDGRIIRSLGDAMTLLREHESRPGIDNRDEVLHGLERAKTDEQRQKAAAAFFAWARELDLILRQPKQARREHCQASMTISQTTPSLRQSNLISPLSCP